ncbi:putative bifunctional diguanylate cyclase/phosphodiesterase [Xanthobacter tagetidis]|jgi:diguanylate cyclase (GGDEF)-like protein|uniref:EAL domain-containing protein n=1 Tax=Xanthobacter tagetidis TaxID=60216 RepID=A0A3L7A0M4_9HYPH|nr:EAL domain-containing protein [Xanthobacter tagetidis]MBB6309515.1 diguanylate cyclase (GGDEF)-like protein [Xanthobacter tagetidis]RLP73624.1 EAL domain-containing protein [Xanthobacter tagetidis]
MARVLAGMTAGREPEIARALTEDRKAELHDRLGRTLRDQFGFEMTYVIDADGRVLYASELGTLGAHEALGWIAPAFSRQMSRWRAGPGSGLAVADGEAGLVAARPLAATQVGQNLRQPLIIVTVDVVDEAFLSDVFGKLDLPPMHLVRDAAAQSPEAVAMANLLDGPRAGFVWNTSEQEYGPLNQLAMIIAAAALVLCLVFLALMVRARRAAAALALSEARARELAQRDSLTGLANRGHFIAELKDALAGRGEGEAIALLFIDLDGFKEVNDSVGHTGGDELLAVVARRLRGCVGDRGLAARFGGDEFVLFTRYRQEAELASLVAALFGVLDIPVHVGGIDLAVSASMGAARAPRDARTSDELLSLADVALYRAKSEGRGTYRLFEPHFERERLERRRTEVELAAALDRGELNLVFQPQVDVESERIVGFEALVRWDHPTRGRILPGAFIPVAEGSRLINRLDAYVLRSACEQAKELPGVTISVNMSPLNLRHAGMVDNIIATLRQTDFDPRRLEIEITESAILDASAEGQDALARLRGLGVRLALDDFGTGHASLVHVRRFPITKIKIDKSFILNLGVQRDAASIVEYVVRLGRSLGITLTAEGVETREQLRFLRAFGAHQAQGYLFSPPLPLQAAAALLKRQAEAESQRVQRGSGELPAK